MVIPQAVEAQQTLALVVIVRLHPPAMFPVFVDRSSYTKSFQSPFGLRPLKLESSWGSLNGPAGAGDGKLSAMPKLVGLYVPGTIVIVLGSASAPSSKVSVASVRS